MNHRLILIHMSSKFTKAFIKLISPETTIKLYTCATNPVELKNFDYGSFLMMIDIIKNNTTVLIKREKNDFIICENISFVFVT